jgi:serine/threonine protein phosphatase PrpC
MKTYSHTITNPRDNFNKDRFSINNEWFTICDGVSGCGERGARAAQIAIDYVNKTKLSALKTKSDLKNFLALISKEIEEFEGATTFTSVFFKNQKGILFHTGDSECYVLNKNDEFTELTTPFTIRYANYLNGKVDKNTVKTGYLSNYLTECLDGKPINPQILSFDLTTIKSILLCSDGANNVPEEEMKSLILSSRNPAKAISERAVDLGSRDDVTCIVVIL